MDLKSISSTRQHQMLESHPVQYNLMVRKLYRNVQTILHNMFRYLLSDTIKTCFRIFMVSGATNNDTINNRSILNGGIRARMRLHSENFAPPVCRGLTNIHISPNYNSGNSQTNSKKTVGISTTTPSGDGASSSNVGVINNSSSNNNNSGSSSSSSSTLLNGHAISITDKSKVSPGNRHATDIQTFTGRVTIKDQSSLANPPENRVYVRNSYVNGEQSAIVKPDPRGVSRVEQSTSVIPGNGPQISADVRGIFRQDQSIPSNTDNTDASPKDTNVNSRNGGTALRIEQPVVATLPDGRVMTLDGQISTRPEQSDQSVNTRRITNEDIRLIRQIEESALNTMGRHLDESSRAARQEPEYESMIIRLHEDLQIPRAEQTINTPHPSHLRGVTRNQQNTNVHPTDDHPTVSRLEPSTVIPLPEGRTHLTAEHVSPAAESRSGMPRIPQSVVSLPAQSVPVPIAGQSVAQAGSSALSSTDDHSEKLPSGWERRYDMYGRRYKQIVTYAIVLKFTRNIILCSFFIIILDIMSIIILEAHLGKDLKSLCLLDGKFVAIHAVEFITLIIIQEARRGKDQIQRDYSTGNTGKVKDNTLSNKAIRDFFILR